MRHVVPVIGATAGLLALGIGVPAWAASASGASGGAVAAAARPADSFKQTNLIANKRGFGARLVDKNLTNAWGLAAGPGEPLWVSDHNSGRATVYSGGINGAGPVALDLTVPVPGGNPTGQVFNPTGAFPVGGKNGSPAIFIVDTDSIGAHQSLGEIAAWDGVGSFVVEDSPHGGAGGKTPARAVFKGLALAANAKAGPELFAADVVDARVDVFNRDFRLLSTPREFRDPKIPAGYAPFGIQNLNNRIYVTYGRQNRSRTDVVAGKGLGFVDVFTVNGQLIRHLAAHGPLNAPWGLALAPKGFGPFAGDLLVGNLGNGWINAFNPVTGRYLGWLANARHRPIAISGLWGLMVGNSAFGGASSVVFSAGPNGYANGLVGVLTPTPAAPGGAPGPKPSPSPTYPW